MNKLSVAKRAQILSLLCEGTSMRAVSRLADVSINTVTKLLVDAGSVCAAFHNEQVRGMQSRRVQVDEIWSFTYAKAKNVEKAKKTPAGAGDTWTWTGLDADSKLIVSWLVGSRDAVSANAFVSDLASRLKNRIQLTSDGLKLYLDAVEDAFGSEIDYAQLVKLYGASGENETRYSPAKCLGCISHEITGGPDPKHISTSYVERQNLTMRMHMRRFTRLTNGFSKKLANHVHMVALYTVFYNWTKIHKTLKVTPAMEAGLTNRVWDMADVVARIEESEMLVPAAHADRDTTAPLEPLTQALEHHTIHKGGSMKRRFLVSFVMLAGAGGLMPALATAGQAPAATAKSVAATKMKTSEPATRRTAWGDPDLQGIWTNHHQVPLQRPDRYAGREFLTDEEVATLDKQALANRDRPPAKGQVGVYNAFWSERNARSRRTSQIVDPPDGKFPPQTEAGRKLVENAVKGRSVGQSYEDRDPFERCITRGMPGTMMPGFYNHIYQILQTPGYVVIHTEMIHDARIIPIDKRPHLPSSVQQWMGDSRGHWEGNTLVVETTNFNGGMTNAYQFSYGVGQGARITERFTLTDAGAIDYKYTVDDPARFTKSWTALSPLEKVEEGLFEYACHEGNNYSTENSLAGVRAKPKSPEDVAKEIQEQTIRLQTR